MALFKLLFKASAKKEPGGIPRPHLERCRIRQGPWRIVYEVDDETKTVVIYKIGHRREICR